MRGRNLQIALPCHFNLANTRVLFNGQEVPLVVALQRMDSINRMDPATTLTVVNDLFLQGFSRFRSGAQIDLVSWGETDLSRPLGYGPVT